MRIEVDKAMKPVRRLRKLLKKSPAELPPDFVHELRTQTRKLEAAVHVLSHTRDPRAKRLLKRIKPIRKAAGDVRDMDVMIEKLLWLGHEAEDGESEALLRLTEKMADARQKGASELRSILERKASFLREKLKRYAGRMRKADPGRLADSAAVPQMLATQLQHWPRLKAENLHEFRIQAKELRYMLQLTPETDESTLDAFARVKDVAGEWHDWLQLREYAGKALNGNGNHPILHHLDAIEQQRLRAALAAANAARRDGVAE